MHLQACRFGGLGANRIGTLRLFPRGLPLHRHRVMIPPASINGAGLLLVGFTHLGVVDVKPRAEGPPLSKLQSQSTGLARDF